ncbi:MAG: hypothetical protein IJL87_07185 [Clostridia bacterium]|nr:hypothetical protein [Clostridia bacterium]
MDRTNKISWDKKANIALAAALAIMFYMYLIRYSGNLSAMYNIKRAVVVSFFFFVPVLAVPLYFIIRRKVSCPVTVAFLAIVTGAAMMVRFALLDYISPDYEGFLAGWIAQIKQAPGLSGWAKPIGDYNMPYLYLLTVIAKFPSVPLYMIKIISILFDVVLAYYVMKLASLKTSSLNAQTAVFVLTLFIPTFFINSAYWAQCDGIYAAFAAAFIYYALSGKGSLAVIFSALAFSFKLQTIFILPIMLIFLLIKKVNLRQLIYFPVTFVALLLPAIFAGKPVKDTVSIYINQTEAYRRLSLKAPSVFQFFYHYDVADDRTVTESCLVQFDMFNTVGIMLAGAAVLVLLYFLWTYRARINNEIIIVSSFLLTIGIPYLLPRMHERYFYLAEVFALAVFAFDRRCWYVPFVTTFVSFCAYSSFIFADTDILPYFRVLSLLYLIIIAVEVKHLYTLVKVRGDSAPILKQETL